MTEHTKLTKRTSQVDYILVDGSGSMSDKWHASMKAIDAIVGSLKTEGVNSDIYIQVFSDMDDMDICAFDANISEYRSMLGLTAPFGGTWLYDAIGIMARRMRDMDPPRGRITIVTDGDTGGDQTVNLTQARSFLDWCRAKGWPVTFIGCDFANDRQAKMLGAKPHEAIGVQKALLTDAARNYGKKAAGHAKGNDMQGFSEDEQQKFGGYLAPPKAKAAHANKKDEFHATVRSTHPSKRDLWKGGKSYLESGVTEVEWATWLTEPQS